MTEFHVDRLIPLGFIVEILYPPREMQNNTLMALFHELSSTHGYLNLKLLPESKGAVFAGEKNNRCEILRDKIILREEVNVVSFESFVESTLSIMRQFCKAFSPQVFVGQQTVVRMLYPLDSQQAANHFLMQSFLHVPEGLGQQLERPLAGIGLRLVFPPTQQIHNEFQVRLEPYFRDQTQLFLENVGRFLPPFREIEEIRTRLLATYAFLKSCLSALS